MELKAPRCPTSPSGSYNDKQPRPRTIIIRFSNRTTWDLMYRQVKSCDFLKKDHLTFTEDLTEADGALRETAKRDGRGVSVIIEGKEIRPTSPALMDTSGPDS